jgi:hypothetical protein
MNKIIVQYYYYCSTVVDDSTVGPTVVYIMLTHAITRAKYVDIHD